MTGQLPFDGLTELQKTRLLINKRVFSIFSILQHHTIFLPEIEKFGIL